MRDFIHRLYPYQAFKLMLQSVQRQRLPDASKVADSTLLNSLSAPFSPPPPFDPVQARTQLVSYFAALKQVNTSSATASSLITTSRQNITQSCLGFHLTIRPSRIPNAGLGVFLHQHHHNHHNHDPSTTPLPAGTIVALYPGTLYQPGEAIFFNSLQNRYILKCNDGIFVDGKPTGLSGYIYRSANGRDNFPGCVPTADTTWMVDWTKAWASLSSPSSSSPISLVSSVSTTMDDKEQEQELEVKEINTSTLLKNPLSVGQIVNNGTAQFPPNVRYQELDLQTSNCPLELQEFLPNIWYSGDWHSYDHDHDGTNHVGEDGDMERIPGSEGLDRLRAVVLVTTRPIENDEELYSTYIE
ncbi:MAG: hypothetical protein J3R72DRAFT_58327 [Linnemannia gamsii]|nr:MAG: hypothetical protein J3R72DRAFT_58327 [Linnemannia gamsii]